MLMLIVFLLLKHAIFVFWLLLYFGLLFLFYMLTLTREQDIEHREQVHLRPRHRRERERELLLLETKADNFFQLCLNLLIFNIAFFAQNLRL